MAKRNYHLTETPRRDYVVINGVVVFLGGSNVTKSIQESSRDSYLDSLEDMGLEDSEQHDVIRTG